MIVITGDGDDNVTLAQQANETIRNVTCEDRGEGLNPRHVYLDGSRRCQCGYGPDLSERRAR
jgi:hypothetical protein